MRFSRVDGTTAERSVARSVIEQIAAREGVDPVELSSALHSAIDPDALEAISTRSANDESRTIQVKFTDCGYTVTVEDGSIRIQND